MYYPRYKTLNFVSWRIGKEDLNLYCQLAPQRMVPGKLEIRLNRDGFPRWMRAKGTLSYRNVEAFSEHRRMPHLAQDKMAERAGFEPATELLAL